MEAKLGGEKQVKCVAAAAGNHTAFPQKRAEEPAYTLEAPPTAPLALRPRSKGPVPSLQTSENK